jgi:Fur family ferric uptake transcriptional regulator
VAKKTGSANHAATLRGAGLRCTPARLAVLEHFHRTGGTQSHNDVVAALDALDRVTIYRVLVDLAEAGLLARTDLGDRVWRFELARHAEEHPHFVCTDCGSVQCLDGLTVAVTGAKVPKAVRARKISIQLKGRCDHCS